jgi:hypothetical protein
MALPVLPAILPAAAPLPAADAVIAQRKASGYPKAAELDSNLRSCIRTLINYSQIVPVAVQLLNVDAQPMLTEQQFEDLMRGFERLTRIIGDLQQAAQQEFEKAAALVGPGVPTNR